MVKRKNRWQLAIWSEQYEQLATQLSKKLQLPLLVIKLLIQRGYHDEQSIMAFLNIDANRLHDPYLLADMDKAVARIRQAAQLNEKIRIYGDYDADGVSSTSILVYTFDKLALHYDYYIPHRMLEGYGLNKAAIDKASEAGVKLIVTVDTGISAYEEVNYAESLGIDIVVTDHHEPPEQLPNAIAVVNPKQTHCSYPFDGLAGVGVAFKLATALLEYPPVEWLGTVALGTIADLMPLEDENRILVALGLQQIKQGDHIGFNALSEASGIDISEMNSTKIGFGLAPRINAAGRLQHAEMAVRLLTSKDEQEAKGLAIELDNLNKERQQIVEEMFVEAEQMWLDKRKLYEQNNKKEPNVIVVSQYGWNVGVIGIVASKLLERYYKPVLVFGVDPQTHIAKGSARSIGGYDLHAALTQCDELLLHYGGHQAAAGMSLQYDNVPILEYRLDELANNWLTEEDFIPELTIDLSCRLSDISIDTIAQINLLEPFGMKNPSPRVLIEDVHMSELKAIGKEKKHLKLLLEESKQYLDVIGFGYGHFEQNLQKNEYISVVGELSINEWNSIKKPQLQLHDLHRDKYNIKLFPSREQFGIIYQYIRKLGYIAKAEVYRSLVGQHGLGHAEIQFIIDVFEELKFIEQTNTHIEAVSSPQKKDLSTSEIYTSVQRKFESQYIS